MSSFLMKFLADVPIIDLKIRSKFQINSIIQIIETSLPTYGLQLKEPR